MTDRLVTVKLPAEWIENHAILTPAELRWGYDNEWISAGDVVALALSGVATDPGPTAAVEELSLLLSDELDRVPDLVHRLTSDPTHVWVYLATAWVAEHSAAFDDRPLETIEQLYTDFGYPTEMEGFINYMPPPPGGRLGIDGLWERLHEFLSVSNARFDTSRRESGSA